MPSVTLLYGALNVLLLVVLSVRVSWVRTLERSFGTELKTPRLKGAVRAHGNLAESVAIATVMLLLCEQAGGSSTKLHLLGGTYFAARCLHAVGLSWRMPPVQIAGAFGTNAMLLAEGIYALMLRR